MARRRKQHRQPDTPEERFRIKLLEECRKRPGMTLKIEKMPQGSMRNHKVRYIPAGSIDFRYLEEQIAGLLGNGSFFVRFVDEGGQPLKEYGYMWLHLAHAHAEFTGETVETDMQKAQIQMMQAYREWCHQNRLALLEPLMERVVRMPADWMKLMGAACELASRMRQQVGNRGRNGTLTMAVLTLMQTDGSTRAKELIKFLQEMQKEQGRTALSHITEACMQQYGQSDGRQAELQTQVSKFDDTTQQETEKRPHVSGSRIHPPTISGQLTYQARRRYKLLGTEGTTLPEDESIDKHSDDHSPEDGS